MGKANRYFVMADIEGTEGDKVGKIHNRFQTIPTEI